jgi:chemotaxis protein histidine kinase CheA
VQELPERVADLEGNIRARKMEQLSSMAHNLRGTGGMYGLMPITTAAARVETLIAAQAGVEAIEREVRSLIETIQRVEGFDAAKSTAAAQRPGKA